MWWLINEFLWIGGFEPVDSATELAIPSKPATIQ
jgi:hypothetical protein